MHTQRDFFGRVLSNEGKPCLAWLVQDGQKSYFKHKVYNDIDQLCNELSDVDFTQNNYYFAVSTLRQQSINQAGKQRVRVRENMHKTQSFILDIDVRPEKPGFYATKEAALEGVKKVQQLLNLPDPIVVDSGFGLHVYWTMAGGVDSVLWSVVASKFKRAIQSIAPEVVADGSRVSDSSGVLRVPGSFNLKNGEHTPVRILQWSDEVVDFGALKNLLDGVIPDVQTPIINQTSYTQSEPVDFKAVAKNCNWFKQYVLNAKSASEPEWYAMLGLAEFLKYTNKEGEELTGSKVAHILSKAHLQYDPEQTYAKYQQARSAQKGPTTCERLRSIDPKRCEGCPFAATVKSPIHTADLARPITTEQTVHTSTVDDKGNRTEETVTIPLPPKPYFRGEDGGVFVRKKAKNESTGEWDEVIEKIYDYDIYPTRRFRSEHLENEGMEIHLWLPKDGLRKFKLPNGFLADAKQLTKFIYDKGAVPEPGKAGAMVKFLTDYVIYMQKEKSAEIEFSSFGWRDAKSAEPKFVLSDGFYTADGVFHPTVVSKQLQDPKVLATASQKGSLEAWKKAFMMYKDIPYSEPYILAIMCAFAAPLMAFTPYAGMMYHMTGHGGAGKSTSQAVMSSVWGAPNGKLLGKQDTAISAFNTCGYLNSLPVAFDELTTISPEIIGNFVLEFTGGRGKTRADRNGENKINTTAWETIICASSNTSIFDKFTFYRKGYTAESMRVFECSVVEADARFQPFVDAQLRVLENNYGVAGRKYIEYVISRTGSIRDVLNKTIQGINVKAKLRNEERFWSAFIACIVVGSKIAKDILHLHEYDVDKLLAFCLGEIPKSRETISIAVSDPISVLAEFVNTNLSSILRMKDNVVDISSIAGNMHSVKARLEYENSKATRMYVSVNSIRDYCKLRNVDPSWLRQELAQAKIITKDNYQVRLTSGTSLPVVNCRCWEIDMQHELLASLVKEEN